MFALTFHFRPSRWSFLGETPTLNDYFYLLPPPPAEPVAPPPIQLPTYPTYLERPEAIRRIN